MTRWMYPQDRGRPTETERFDPLAEGARYALSEQALLAIWDHARAEATDRRGRGDEARARRRFHELAQRAAARGGGRGPDIGRVTRVSVEIDRAPFDVWTRDETSPRTPGRESLVAAEARRSAATPAAVMRSAEQTTIDPEAAELVARARSGGAPLEAALRSRLEAALGTRLDGVRVHTGAEADSAARALGARAFAIGADVFFRRGAYRPEQRDGQRLIAHEVAHTVQARGAAAAGDAAMTVSEPGDAVEHEADAFADAFVDSAFITGASVDAARPRADLPAVRPATAPAAARTIHRVPDAQSFPGFSQGGYDSCGAASVVSALMIWDKQHADPASPNHMVVNACNILLTELSYRRTTIIAKLDKVKAGKGETLYDAAKSDLTTLRDLARAPGAALTEANYQALANVMYILYSSRLPGMSSGDISTLLDKLGLGGRATEGSQSFDGMFDTAVLKGLSKGQIAQLNWYARVGKPDPQGNVGLVQHAFLVGRFESGNWFFSDQGSSPPAELTAATLPALKGAISAASAAGTTNVYTGTPSLMAVGGFTGVRLLGDRDGVDKAAQVVTPGKFLAEVDAGPLTNGDKIYAWDFVTRAYSFNEARNALGGTGANGGLIVEMPKGVFSLYKTNLVSDANLNVPGIDEDDSKDGLLAQHIFFGAWLLLCSANACRATPLKVY